MISTNGTKKRPSNLLKELNVTTKEILGYVILAGN